MFYFNGTTKKVYLWSILQYTKKKEKHLRLEYMIFDKMWQSSDRGNQC